MMGHFMREKYNYEFKVVHLQEKNAKMLNYENKAVYLLIQVIG